ncbi:MAG: Ig-like domain-containing protein [Acidobacteriota bacterium]|nr:Ig-like domain-containing protein [Acidobacteriota bacterium]
MQFSKPTNRLTVGGSTLLEAPQGGTPIAGTIVVSADATSATFTPSSPLSPSAPYIVQATNGITESCGSRTDCLPIQFHHQRLISYSFPE